MRIFEIGAIQAQENKNLVVGISSVNHGEEAPLAGEIELTSGQFSVMSNSQVDYRNT